MAQRSMDAQRRARWIVLVGAALLLAVVLLLWRHTPLAALAEPGRLAQWMGRFGNSFWSPFAMVGVFVGAGFIAFPVTVLITATALVFSPLIALAVSMTGSLASAVTLYFAGAKLMRGTLRRAFARPMDRVSAALEDRSVIAIAAVRMIPVAPFSVVNLAAGSIGVRLRDYVLGTALGLAPGIAVLTVFGQQLRSVWERPTMLNVGALAGIVLAWLGLSLLLQRLVARWRARRAQG